MPDRRTLSRLARPERILRDALGVPHILAETRRDVTLATAQSGDPESPHFADQLPRWRAGTLARLTLEPARLAAESELVLAP